MSSSPGPLPLPSSSYGSLWWAGGLVMTALACSPPTTPVTDLQSPSLQAHVVDVQGHRGARGLHPENTLVGFRAALAIGVTTLEMDLGITRDGLVVVHHDEQLNPDVARGPDGHWLDAPTPSIKLLSWSELSRYDVGRLRPGSAYAERFPVQRGADGVGVPQLGEVIAMAEKLSGRTIRYNVETKLSPLDPSLTVEPSTFAARVLAVLRANRVVARTTVQSFDWRTLRELKKLAPELASSCLSSQSRELDTIERGRAGPSPWTAGLDVDDYGGSVPQLARAAGCSTWSPDQSDIDAANVAEAHQLGLRVAVWTVNEPASIHRVLELEVDSVISDYPDRVRRVLAERGATLPPALPAATRP